MALQLVLLQLANAFWRLPCAKPIAVERADPIVNPGQVAGHIHTIMGASAFSGSANNVTIKQSACTSCIVTQDLSNYWIATMFYQYDNGTMQSVSQVGGMLVYYLQRRGYDSEPLKAFPDGLRMIAGTASKSYWDSSPESQAVSYACLNYNGPAKPETHAFPHYDCPDGLRVQVFFPSCWDGVNVDSPDHKSHMAYPSGVNSGSCPDTHPVHLISIFFEVIYETNKFKAGWIDSNGKPFRAMPFFWSTGDNSGYGHHGDFMNGWNTSVLQTAVDNCNASSGVIEQCPYFQFNNELANGCLSEYGPIAAEVVSGQLEIIPGLLRIPVQSFNPCGYSPTYPHDNSAGFVPLGTCTGPYQNITAYTIQTYAHDGTAGSPGSITENPCPIDQNGYLGCWADNGTSRAIEHQLPGGATYTIDSCRAAVQALSPTYVVFGMQYGGECWASTSNTSYMQNGQSDNCLMVCNKDPLHLCGNGKVNQVYSVNDTTPISVCPYGFAFATPDSNPAPTPKASSASMTVAGFLALWIALLVA